MNRQRLLIITLLVSLAANLFLIGGIGYRVANTRDFRDTRPLPPNVSWIVRDLDEERRRELAPLLEESAAASRPLRQAMFAAQRRVNELMAAPDFSAVALDEAMAELRAAADRYQALAHEHTVAILSRLSAEERRLAREFIQRRGPRGGGPDIRPGGDRPPPSRL